MYKRICVSFYYYFLLFSFALLFLPVCRVGLHIYSLIYLDAFTHLFIECDVGPSPGIWNIYFARRAFSQIKFIGKWPKTEINMNNIRVNFIISSHVRLFAFSFAQFYDFQWPRKQIKNTRDGGSGTRFRWELIIISSTESRELNPFLAGSWREQRPVEKTSWLNPRDFWTKKREIWRRLLRELIFSS